MGATVDRADLDAGHLTFSAVLNANGEGYATFDFKVSDGFLDSVAAYTMTIDVDAVNDPAAGRPAIAGTAAVGETLTAGAGSVTDADGLPDPATFTWQWFRVDADGTSNPEKILGAEATTYTVTAAEGGRKVTVEVGFTDADGTGETRTSDAWPAGDPVPAAVPGAPRSLTAAPGDGQVVLSWAAPEHDGGAAVTAYRYRHAQGATVPDGTAWTDVADGPDAGSDAGDETTVTVSGLDNGQLYAFEIVAVNSVGEGAKAGPETATPRTRPTPSPRPTSPSPTRRTRWTTCSRAWSSRPCRRWAR